MVGDILLSLFIAVPIVLLTAAYVYYSELNREEVGRSEDFEQKSHPGER